MDATHRAEAEDRGTAAVAARRPRHARRRRTSATWRRRRIALLAFIFYAACAVPAYLPGYPGDPHRLPTACGCQDPQLQAWMLGWTPFALAHGHNPFVTGWIEVPHGANLVVNVSLPLLGLLGAPLTVAVNSVATFNLWMFLAFPISATACFVLLRRWVRWTPAAVVGGLVYAFSPYAVAEGTDHLHLVFIAFPPLALLFFDELLARQRRRPIRVGLGLGVLAGAQFFISSEVFASTAFMAAVGIGVAVVLFPRQALARWRHAAIGLGTAVLSAGVLIAYPLWIQLRGPDRYQGSAHGTFAYGADFLGIVIPSLHQLLAPASALAHSNYFILGDSTENGNYIGFPLLVVFLLLVLWLGRRPIIRFVATMAVIAELLALGPTLTINGRLTGIPLPDRLLDHLPFFNSFVDARFAVFTDLSVAVVVAIGLGELHQRYRNGLRAAADEGRGIQWPALLMTAVAMLVVVASLLPLLPAWPYQSDVTDVPPLFTSSQLDQQVPAGSVALTYPYPTVLDARAMGWQSASDMRFRLLGGYLLEPGPTGTASFDAFPPDDPSVPATMVADQEGSTAGTYSPGATTASPAQFRQFLERYKVDTVFFQPVGAHPDKVLDHLTAAIGRRPQKVGGVETWFHVTSSLGSSSRS